MVGSTKGQKRTPNTVGLDLLAEFARKNELAGEFDVSPRTIERWVRLGIIPPPLRLGGLSLHHIPTLKQHMKDRAVGRLSRKRTKSARRHAGHDGYVPAAGLCLSCARGGAQRAVGIA